MRVANSKLYSSEELTQELERLSGWKRDNPNGFTVGFLLRKLPDQVNIRKNKAKPGKYGDGAWRGQYTASYSTGASTREYADTPEDAASKLCILLFKQNILTKEAK